MVLVDTRSRRRESRCPRRIGTSREIRDACPQSDSYLCLERKYYDRLPCLECICTKRLFSHRGRKRRKQWPRETPSSPSRLSCTDRKSTESELKGKQREQMVKDHSLVIHHLHTSLQMPLAIHHHQFIFIQERPKASANVCYPDCTVWLTRGLSQLSVLRAYHGWPDAHLLDLSTINVNTT